MSLGRDDVRRIAQLARLAVPEAAEVALANELNAILEIARRLDSAVTGNTPPQVGSGATLPSRAALRADVVTEADCRDALLALAPSAADGMYRVPRVIE